MGSGRHDHVVSRLGGRDAAVHAAPGHDHRVGREPTLKDLVPAHERAAVGGEKLVHPVREPALQLVFVLEPELANPRLCERARLPLGLRRLVAADMDPASREQRHHFRQHVLIEADGRVSGIEDVLVHAPAHPDGEGVAAVAELGIRGNGGLGMTRHLDLRHDRHEARAGVGHDLADVVLRVEATVRLAVEPPLGRVPIGPADDRLRAPGAHLGETRVLLDLEPPPLIIGQVPVKAVELIERREIDELLHELLRHEVASHVQVDAAPREPREVLDRDSGDAPRHAGHFGLPENRGREELAQGLDAVERAGRPVGANRDAGPADVEPIPLVSETGEGGVEADRDRRRPGGRGGRHGEPQTGSGEEVVSQQLAHLAQGAIGHDHGAGPQRERSRLRGDVRRARHDGGDGVRREQDGQRGEHRHDSTPGFP